MDREETAPEPPAGEPEPPRRCTKYRLTVESMEVSQIDDGFLGGALETTWTFTVNGQVQTYVNDSLEVGTHSIGKTFFVDVPAETSTIKLVVSGVEDDPVFDDPLPGFTHVWGEPDNWGAGAQSGSGNDSNITYTLNYSISCAEDRATFALSRDVLMEYGEAKAEQRGVKTGRETMLSWAISRVERDGWELVDSTDDRYVFRGNGTLPRKLAEQFD